MHAVRPAGLDHSDQETLDRLLNQLQNKSHRNRLREKYYDGKNVLRDLGISLPPSLKSVETVLDWPAKAVDALAHRCRLEGFVMPSRQTDPYEIRTMWAQNSMDIEAPQAHVSALIHATAFIATTRGDVQSGEPEVLVTTRDALTGTGLWNPRKRALDAALSIAEMDDAGNPTVIVMYLPGRVLTFTKVAQGWKTDRVGLPVPFVPVEPLTFRPRHRRPFGSSRVSRAVMSMTDEAVRTVLRTEVSAEFYSSPQRWALNVDPSAFQDAEGNTQDKWTAILGRVWALSGGNTDEGAPPPQVGQFPQMTMQPHIEHLRGLSQRFAAATNLPVSSLGIVQDNPASAEAIYAAKEDLIIDAEAAIETFGVAWARAARTGVMLRDGLSELPPELLTLRAKFRDPSTPSRAAAADAVVKQIGALPWLAESDVVLEQLGYDETYIARLKADKRRAEASALVRQAAEAARRPEQGERAEADGGDEG